MGVTRYLKILIIGYFVFHPFNLWADKWQSIQSQHFVVHFTELDKKVAERTIQIAEDAYRTITAEFEITPEKPTSIFVFPSRKEINNAGLQDWAVGQASVTRQASGCDNIILIQSPRSNLRITLEKIIRHELTHIVLGAVFKKGYLPRWLNEGLAMYEAKEWEFANNIKVGETYLTKKLFPLSCITYTFPNDEAQAQLAYAQSFDVLLFMMNKYGKDKIIRLIKELASGTELDLAFKKSLGVNLSELEIAWQKSLKKRFNWVCVITNSYLIWIMFPVLCLVVYIIKRHQVIKKLKRWEEEEGEDW
ncbi:MAG: peptidase MA family metallohydrolase [bacterium]|nr:peptidase MA family metallohydrolase [bacterium]